MLNDAGGPRGREHPPPSFLASLSLVDPQPVFLETWQLAKKLRLAVNTLERWRCQGRGPPPHYLGRSVRYFWPEVVEWMKKPH